jgi:hypothetical protein
MVIPKRTGILGGNVQFDAKSAECLSGNGVSVDSSIDIRSSLMNRAVDLESRGVDGVHIASLADFAFLVYENEVRDFHVFEGFEERIDPEMVGFDRVADRDVACPSFVAITVFSHPAEGLLLVLYERN